MGFFIENSVHQRQLKRKKQLKNKKDINAKRLKDDSTTTNKDIEIQSDSDGNFSDHDVQNLESYDSDNNLSNYEIRVKNLIEEEKKKTQGQNILKKIQIEDDERNGRLKKKMADDIQFVLEKSITLNSKQHKLSIICLKVSWDNVHLYSSSKDFSIVQWNLLDHSKVASICFKYKKIKSNQSNKHKGLVLSMAVSNDNKYLITGDEKGIINIWSSVDLTFVQTFEGHKKAVTDLAVCYKTNSLYSTSGDGLVKVWNLYEMGYMESLFGHQEIVTSVDIMNEDRVITAGGSDKSVRVWKIAEETQLVYNGHSGSIDIVRKLSEGFFLSAGDDGSICLWNVLKKKPIFVFVNAHGKNVTNAESNWITALTVIPNSDIFATGSCNGKIVLWKWAQAAKNFYSIKEIPVKGFINSLQFTSDAKYLIVGVAKEHKLGRWQVIDGAKNSILCIPITFKHCNSE